MGLAAPVLDEVNVTGGAVGADVAVAGLVAVALDATASIVSVSEFTIRTFQLRATVIGSLQNSFGFKRKASMQLVYTSQLWLTSKI